MKAGNRNELYCMRSCFVVFDVTLKPARGEESNFFTCATNHELGQVSCNEVVR